ncbi:MAG: monovalent cation/H+ antiporter complex subunit F [Clostridia bacterium]
MDILNTYFFPISLIFMAVLTFMYLARSILGPQFFDRILGINSLNTIIILMICIIAVMQEESYIVDVALIYAMLSFVTVVILCKAYLRSHKMNRENDFKNIREAGKKDD